MEATAATPTPANIENLCVNTIRTLAMDAVQAANSGHPGTPMAMAPVAYLLWNEILRFDPDDPIWPNRDRFVLSMGHASMLLYSMLHLTGVKAVNAEYEVPGHPSVTLDDIKNFRQLDSRCPGHPEYRWTSGVETTTGPLGQGVGTSVGMAIASKWQAAYFNKPGHELFDYRVYVFCGDGDMMEGISHEAASLAGHLKLDNLCWIYDNNKITIEGNTAWAFSEDVATRFIGYGWNVTRVGDANDLDMLRRAFEVARKENTRPTLIIVDSHIAWGAPNKQDTHAAHGEPLGEEEIRLTKRAYGWPEDEKFLVPDGVYDNFKQGIGARGKQARDEWFAKLEDYKKDNADLADQLVKMQKRELPDGWDKDIPLFPTDAKGLAGRDASAKVLNAVAKNVPWLIGGSADLAPSTKTRLTFEGAGDFTADNRAGRNFHFGIREHEMSAILNGLALSKIRPYGSGFMIFSDYARAGIRLGAIMEIPTIHIFTHDSIGVGEDGPTHQPIEQLASMRAIPGLIVLRPGDPNEVAEAWRLIMKLRHEPAVLVLSRQAMPTLDRTKYASAEGVQRGGYVLADSTDGGQPDVILIGTGTEVGLCVEAYEQLVADGVKARVVSLPSWEIFEHQDEAYKESVLPAAVKARVGVEQAGTFGWRRYVNSNDAIVAMKTFGASAPLKELTKKFGFTVENVVATAKREIEKYSGDLTEGKDKKVSALRIEQRAKESAARQYVISKPTGFHTASLRFNQQLAALHNIHNVNIIDSLDIDDDKLTLLTENELTLLKAEVPGLVIEPNILYKMYRHPLMEGFQELHVPASVSSKTIIIRAVEWETGTPLPGVTIYLIVDQSHLTGFRGITDDKGVCRFTTRGSTRNFDALVALPQIGHWNRRLTNITTDDEYELALRPLPSSHTALYDWGHEFAEMKDGLSYDGKGIKIGVIDSGIRRDHPGLQPAGGYNCVYDEDSTLWFEDYDGHGTHCAGIIAAMIHNSRGVKGYVPKAEIRAYRVFGKDSNGAATFDILKAIKLAVDDGCDIINMSFGSPTLQSAIRTKTEYAFDKGVLCIAATGNEGGAVSYPAALPSVLGIGAFGKFGSYPDDSLHKEVESAIISADGRYFCANFSNHGDNIDFCAPGVAILSTVPGGDYSAWDGTSMACPQVAGITALALAAHPDVLNAPRDAERVERLIAILRRHAKILGFGSPYEGAGCLTVPPLL